MADMNYDVEYPDYFDGYEYAIVAKGYFADITLRTENAIYRPIFFDLSRFAQDVSESIASSGYHVESNLVLIAQVDRSHIDRAMSAMASSGFAELSPVGQ